MKSKSPQHIERNHAFSIPGIKKPWLTQSVSGLGFRIAFPSLVPLSRAQALQPNPEGAVKEAPACCDCSPSRAPSWSSCPEW